jgi:hypothetical protein
MINVPDANLKVTSTINSLPVTKLYTLVFRLESEIKEISNEHETHLKYNFVGVAYQ